MSYTHISYPTSSQGYQKPIPNGFGLWYGFGRKKKFNQTSAISLESTNPILTRTKQPSNSYENF